MCNACGKKTKVAARFNMTLIRSGRWLVDWWEGRHPDTHLCLECSGRVVDFINDLGLGTNIDEDKPI